MAKSKVNKSAAIREALAANPKAHAKDIVQILGKQGLKVQVPLVYFIKSKTRHTKQKATRAGLTVSNGNAIDLIRGIKKLAKEAGGLSNLKKFVDALSAD